MDSDELRTRVDNIRGNLSHDLLGEVQTPLSDRTKPLRDRHLEVLNAVDADRHRKTLIANDVTDISRDYLDLLSSGPAPAPSRGIGGTLATFAVGSLLAICGMTAGLFGYDHFFGNKNPEQENKPAVVKQAEENKEVRPSERDLEQRAVEQAKDDYVGVTSETPYKIIPKQIDIQNPRKSTFSYIVKSEMWDENPYEVTVEDRRAEAALNRLITTMEGAERNYLHEQERLGKDHKGKDTYRFSQEQLMRIGELLSKDDRRKVIKYSTVKNALNTLKYDNNGNRRARSDDKRGRLVALVEAFQ